MCVRVCVSVCVCLVCVCLCVSVYLSVTTFSAISLGQINYVFSLASPPACFLDRHFRLFFINMRGRGAHFRAELTETGCGSIT